MTLVPDTPKLSPDKHPQQDLFICDVADAVLKDVMQQMEHPFYSLSKKPVTTVRTYRHGDHWIKVTPSVEGLATIYDKDLLIYAISQLVAKLNSGEEIDKRIRINSREFLIFTNRGTGGKDYEALVTALERLRGTTISTNVVTGSEEQTDIFGLIDKGTIRRKNGLDGRLLYMDIVLSDWVFNAVKAKEVLTLNRDYFRLSKPYERRAYEIARKHCGHSAEWKIGLEKLKKKMGAESPLKKFRYFIRELAKHDHLPDYTVMLIAEEDQVVFRRRGVVTQDSAPRLSPDALERAKPYVPKDQDIYVWVEDWKLFWEGSGSPKLRSADAAFLGYCKARSVR